METTYAYVAILTIFNVAIIAYAFYKYVASKSIVVEEPAVNETEGYYEPIDKPNRVGLVNRAPEEAPIIRTDEEVAAEIEESFEILDYMIDKAIRSDLRSMIIAGPAGLGKSFNVDTALNAWDTSGERYTVAKGHVTPASLYKILYSHRESDQVLIFDDADSVFGDEKSLNFLKAALDTTEKRVISNLSERGLKDDKTGEAIPKTFEFEGTVIFITNLDFDLMIDAGHRLSPHFKAMLSRAHYIDMGMRTLQDYIVRIKQVIGYGMLERKGLNRAEVNDVISFIEKNAANMRELSLRAALKIGDIRHSGEANWAKIAKRTTCRRR